MSVVEKFLLFSTRINLIFLGAVLDMPGITPTMYNLFSHPERWDV